MPVCQELSETGVLEVVLDLPPVNAVGLDALAELIDIFTAVPRRPEVRVVVLRGEGRGFLGGGDVKEVQRLAAFEGILGQARGSAALVSLIHDCEVPVVAAVHAYCIGLGVLLAGAADVVVADQECRFVLAEVDNGATSGAIAAIGLMPDKRLRQAMFTCEPVFGEELARYGTVVAVAEVSDVVVEARRLAEVIAAKRTEVVRATKRSINGSVGRDMETAYRQELSHTFELNMTGEATQARQTFVSGERQGYLSQP